MRFAILFPILAVLLLAGCATSPVVIKSSQGYKFIGSAILHPGKVDISAVSSNGVSFNGEYRYNYTKTSVLVFKLSDGRSGQGAMANTISALHGIGHGQTLDGTKFDILVGDSTKQANVAW